MYFPKGDWTLTFNGDSVPGSVTIDTDWFGKLIMPKKPNNNAPKSIKGDYELYIHGNKIELFDKKDGAMVEAKCHPDDDFDIGDGIKEAFKKLNVKREEIRKQKEEEEKKIKVGDWVEVIDAGRSYSTREGFFKKNGIADYAGRFRYGVSPYIGTEGKVLFIEKGSGNLIKDQERVAVIEVPKEGYYGNPDFRNLDCYDAIYLVKIDGLKKVAKPNV